MELNPLKWFMNADEEPTPDPKSTSTEVADEERFWRGLTIDKKREFWLNSSVAWACIDRTASMISTTPLHHRKLDDKGNAIEILPNSAVAKVIRNAFPAESIKPFLYAMQVICELHGEAIGYIHRGLDGLPRYVEPVYQYNRKERKERLAGDTWEITLRNDTKSISATDMDIIHFRGPFFGLIAHREPISPFEYAAAIGLNMQRNARRRINAELRKALQDVITDVEDVEVRRKLSESYKEQIDNKPYRVAFWPPSVEKIQSNMMDTYAESISKLSVFEIALVLGWPPQLFGFSVGDTSLTGTLVEALNKILYTTSLDPKMARIEDELYMKLVPESMKESENTVVKFDALPFRLTEVEQAEITEILVAKAGVFNRDEGRVRHGAKPVGGTMGEQFAQPAGTPGTGDSNPSSNRRKEGNES